MPTILLCHEMQGREFVEDTIVSTLIRDTKEDYLNLRRKPVPSELGYHLLHDGAPVSRINTHIELSILQSLVTLNLLLEGEETGPVGKLVVCDSVS